MPRQTYVSPPLYSPGQDLASVNVPDVKNPKVGQQRTPGCNPMCRGTIAAETRRDAEKQQKSQSGSSSPLLGACPVRGAGLPLLVA